jgi:hypothetical protein
MADVSLGRRVVLEWPMLVVMAGVGFGMFLVIGDRIVTGTAFMGLSMLVGAGLRLVLPTRTAGTLAIRRRAVDVTTYGGLGLTLIILGLLVKGLFSG